MFAYPRSLCPTRKMVQRMWCKSKRNQIHSLHVHSQKIKMSTNYPNDQTLPTRTTRSLFRHHHRPTLYLVATLPQ